MGLGLLNPLSGHEFESIDFKLVLKESVRKQVEILPVVNDWLEPCAPLYWLITGILDSNPDLEWTCSHFLCYRVKVVILGWSELPPRSSASCVSDKTSALEDATACNAAAVS
jgi:hypothetical protein